MNCIILVPYKIFHCLSYLICGAVQSLRFIISLPTITFTSLCSVIDVGCIDWLPIDDISLLVPLDESESINRKCINNKISYMISRTPSHHHSQEILANLNSVPVISFFYLTLVTHPMNLFQRMHYSTKKRRWILSSNSMSTKNVLLKSLNISCYFETWRMGCVVQIFLWDVVGRCRETLS